MNAFITSKWKACAAAVLAASNCLAQVSNPGFEDAGASSSTAAGWSVTQAAGGPVYGARTNSTARSGAWCFQLHVASVGAGPVVELAQANIPINGGTTYPFTFYAKALTGSAGYNAQWRIVWNAGGDTGFHPFTPGNNTYALSSNAVTAPLSATSATLFFYLAGAASPSLSADLLLDDVAFASGAVPPPTSTNAPALQVVAGALISFETTSNASYQVQWSSGATPSSDTWSNLCPAIIGDGRTNRAFDAVLGRSYRVLMVE